MYPAAELDALARRKAVLRARISLDRLRVTALATEVAKPIDWIDRAIIQWKRISPFAKLAAVPLGLLLQRGLVSGKKTSLASRALRLMPLVLSAVRMFKAQKSAAASRA